MSYIYIPEISPEPHWVSDEIPEDAVFSYGTHYDQTGHKRTEETKRKMSEVHKGNSYRKGFKDSEETKRKKSESHKGKKQTEYQKKRTSEVHSGKITSEETKRKMSEGMREAWKRRKNER